MIGLTLVLDLKFVPYIGPSDAEILLLKNNALFNMIGIESPVWCKLKTVIADDNKISSVKVLLLDNNSISDLKEQDVAPYPNLRRLNLAFNKMAVLPYRIFEFVPKLRSLNVSNNSLRIISAETR
ncbi:Leucine-rich repeat transmembrane neuronal protein 1 [Portunus trituberculatus]|uniref:Leucine-rich repeat transmembrane neuronal protein 1 n=1 Tax=Portunus trituberculatus TaxID=210409 RepID=A0A5B7GUK9_PORTR|nr:Leucine-rich repeat transmembrane neuronal protein 1 [Portunus trituberculatus]